MILEEFGKKVCSALRNVMGEDYQIEFREVVKNNDVCLHGIVISKKNSNIAPAVYIDELYEEYEKGRTFGDIIYDILRVYKSHAKEQNMNMDFFTQFEKAKDRILYKLIQRETNAKLLQDVPYIKWNDLALVFYYAFEDEKFGHATILIRNAHLTMWKTDTASVYRIAKMNMLRLRPEEMLPIKQLIQEFVDKGQGSGSDVMLPEEFHEAMKQDVTMYVLSNRERMFGAATLLYSQSLKNLTRRLNKNLVILPSSVHEVLLVPDDGITEKEFYQGMVKEVNDTQVEPEERLSYNVYYYDRISERITIM
ncbi:MAG: DUF5688 family protein [Bacillus sp. (in: Bacteria)]|nr:DUF5688 family protein [Bacillus sp. (in: firmicutes)]MCM1427618.1 DUF5688 family protein [Eubacterium sp.]